jgi:2,4-dienoyl-CoA reductase-like NADH-dependent reductase (Old Yellow Enzyme family)
VTFQESLDKAFSKYNFMNLTLRNRFIRSATFEGMASLDGSPLPQLKQLYADLASGGVGLISTSACLADQTWLPQRRAFLSMHSDDSLPAWEDMVQAAHGAGALISLQLAPFYFFDGKPVGPYSDNPDVHQLSPDEIERIVHLYAAAALRAQKIGMDAVQIHGGHGYPLSQFLSPYFNRREDEYGGSHLNRARIFIEIRHAVAEMAGKQFPIWIKMNSLDGVHGGIATEDAEIYGEILSNEGYGAIEVTGGSPKGTHDSRGPVNEDEWFEGYYLEQASRVRTRSKIPVVAVGGIRKLEMIDAILSQGTSDLISMSRPFIREPNLINRWASGDYGPSLCISCNGCFTLIQKGKQLACVHTKTKDEDSAEAGS